MRCRMEESSALSASPCDCSRAAVLLMIREIVAWFGASPRSRRFWCRLRICMMITDACRGKSELGSTGVLCG
eukprot:IDg6051t1